MKFRKKKIIRIICMAFSLMLILNVCAAATSVEYEEFPFESYTYWRDLESSESKTSVAIKQLYQPQTVINSSDIFSGGLSGMTDVCFSPNGNLYVLDTTVPAIVVTDSQYRVVNTITKLYAEDKSEVSFKGSESLYVTQNEIYICGTESACVWVTDLNGNILKTLELPESDIIPDDFVFSPKKITVDSKGYAYVLSQGSYYGALLYSETGDFLGFYGANRVETSIKSVLNNIWQKLFVNDVKKSAMIKSLPYQFTDLDVGINDYIYTTTGATSSNAKGQVKLLNPSGNNILKNSSFNFGDNETVKISKQTWIDQNLSEIAADGEFMYILDCGHGKVFLYDMECNLLGVFGGGMSRGTQKGMFKSAVAIAVNGDDVVICDKAKGSLTVYRITDYGRLVKSSQALTLKSKYLEAEDGWKQALEEDKNCQLAYRGLAKAELRRGNYDKAMDYAKTGADRYTYSQAFSKNREKIILNNFNWVFPLLIVCVLGIIIAYVFLRKKKTQKNDSWIHYMFTLTHPFDGFGQVVEKGKGSLIIGTSLVFLLYATEILKVTSSNFAFSYYNPDSFNAAFVLIKTVGIVALWTMVNWAVCVILGGIGTVKRIYLVITYSLTPLIISNVLYTVLSNIVLESEAGFLNIMVTIFWIYTLFLLIVGTIKIQDFGFGKFIGTSILTVIGIMIVIFLIFIFILLMQQLVMFVFTLINEMIYR